MLHLLLNLTKPMLPMFLSHVEPCLLLVGSVYFFSGFKSQAYCCLIMFFQLSSASSWACSAIRWNHGLEITESNLFLTWFYNADSLYGSLGTCSLPLQTSNLLELARQRTMHLGNHLSHCTSWLDTQNILKLLFIASLFGVLTRGWSTTFITAFFATVGCSSPEVWIYFGFFLRQIQQARHLKSCLSPLWKTWGHLLHTSHNFSQMLEWISTG